VVVGLECPGALLDLRAQFAVPFRGLLDLDGVSLLLVHGDDGG
jgi:hypothetical protein